VRRVALVALLALAGCATRRPSDAETFAGAALGAAAGSFAAVVASPAPAPVAVVVQVEPDGGTAVDWPDAGAGGCSPVADRVCCTPQSIFRLMGQCMSWGIKVASKDKEKLKAVVDQACASEHGMPKAVGEAIKYAINTAQPAPGEVLVLESSGHVGSSVGAYSGNGGNFSLLAVPLHE
jgi:hypothetical protein